MNQLQIVTIDINLRKGGCHPVVSGTEEPNGNGDYSGVAAC